MRDRRAVLLIRAAARGDLGLAPVFRSDRWADLRTALIANDAERCDLARLVEARLSYSLAVNDVEGAREAYGDLRNLMMPWDTAEARAESPEVKAAVDQWKAMYGDPSDPEVARRIAAAEAELKRMAATPPPALTRPKAVRRPWGTADKKDVAKKPPGGRG